MFSLIGAIIGFVAFIVKKNNAAGAALLAVVGLVLGWVASFALVIEEVDGAMRDIAAGGEGDANFGYIDIVVLIIAALPGVAGAFFQKSNDNNS